MSIIKNKFKYSKKEVLKFLRNFLFLTIGCALLAFGDVVFLVPCNIVSGGITGIAIIVDYYVKLAFPGFDSVDITIAILQVLLFFVGLFVLGKKFSLHTLFASLLYPAMVAIFYRLNVGSYISNQLVQTFNDGSEDLTNTLLAGIFGGVFVGAGVGFCYLGEGSSGGLDVISCILAKYTDIKEDLSGLIIDASIILVGAFCLSALQNEVAHALIGFLSALCCAAAVQLTYVYSNSYIIADIISDKYKEIGDYIHNEMGHGTTVIDTIGGYTGEDRKLIRVAFSRMEMTELRGFIAKTDPKAFVTFTSATTINGEGFRPWVQRKKKQKKNAVDVNSNGTPNGK